MSFYANCDLGDKSHSVSSARDGEAGRRATLDFNPAGNEAIGWLKAFMACVMQSVINARDAEEARYARLESPDFNQTARHRNAMWGFATALTQIESGKMFAVGAIAATLADG